MKLIYQGAEARLLETEYLGKKCIVKEREAKGYRREELDREIREKRTKDEAMLMHKARIAGVRTPSIFKVEKKECRITMEFVEGKKLRKALNKKNVFLCREIGRKVALLHNSNLIHGDLTTSNIILEKNGSLCFFDFGLAFVSEKIEDKAVDLLVFKKTFNATHFELKKEWELIVQGYERTCSKGKKAVEHIKEIEQRIRYH